ncbi:MAG: hypothetical protein ABEH77_11400 [Halobacteriaceae archaeon]
MSGTASPDDTTRGSLTREREKSLRDWLELLYLNYTGLVYFVAFELLLVVAALVLGVVGEGAIRTGLRTQTDLKTAWSGVAGGLTIMYGILLGPPLLIYYAWDFIDRYR